MPKDPAFLFYVGDWLGGTILMNRHQKGAYMDLLMAQFNQGHMSITQIETLLGKDIELWESTLKNKFTEDPDGLFYNERLETEQIKRTEYGKSRRKNFEGRTKKDPKSKAHMKAHMENEVENKIEKRNYINEIIEVWKQSYFIERETEYEVVNIGQESSAAGKLATIYKRKYPNAKTEEALKGFEVYFRACLNIEDNWLNDHMSMSIIISKFNVINTILKNGTKQRGKQPATSDKRLAQIIHAFFEPKKD